MKPRACNRALFFVMNTDYKENPLVSLEDLCTYVRVEPGVDDELLKQLCLAATGALQQHTTRQELHVGGSDDGLFDPITETKFAQIQLWIKSQVAYWYNNREAAGQKLEIQPAFHYLVDSVRTYE